MDILNWFKQNQQPDPEVEELRRKATLGGRIDALQNPFEGQLGQPMGGLESFPAVGRGNVRLPAQAAPGGVPANVPQRVPVPAANQQIPPMQGQVQGGPLIPRGPVPGGGPQGNTYQGSVNPPPSQSVVPAGGSPRQAAQAATQQSGPRVDTTGLGSAGQDKSLSGFLKNAWGNLNPFQKATVGGAGIGAGTTLWDMLGDGGIEAEQALAGQPQPPGQQQQRGVPAVRNELPAAWRSSIEEMIPNVDYENLPRPDFEGVRSRLADLAPEAPEERNWLDKLPSNAKNIIGFGILLGPIGLLLGAGLGMSENRAIDRHREEQWKKENREHLREMIGFDLDWAKAERSMALEEQQGRRDQARENITTERSMQKWGMEDEQWKQDMTLGDMQIASAQNKMNQQPSMDMDNLFERAMMTNPMGAFQMYQAMTSADDFPLATNKAEEDMLSQMVKANIVRAMMGQ